MRKAGVIMAQYDSFYARLRDLYAVGDLEVVEAFLRTECSRMAGTGANSVLALNQLACHLRNVGKLAESGRVFEAALSCLEDAGMRETPQYAIVLLNRAGLDRLLGAYDQAARGFEEADRLLARAGESYAYERVSVLNNLSLVYMDLGDAQHATALARRALPMLTELEGHEAEVATTRANLSNMLLATGDAEAARHEAQEAIGWYEGANDLGVHYASACAALGSAFYALHDERAALWLERARETLHETVGATMDYARVCASLAVVKRAEGLAEEADELERETAFVERACRGGGTYGSSA